ncbi:MAG: 3-phosphoserine/phosphohydroxythreonine transaminase [Acidobacteria bacterium]|nr:MAG: 3-phosphoserine/phosphohydroxythreonine transaminase [Acidobacteriota bacterium]REK03015.1 MAG: 3-phosphoserine/phosphohydroxythreonine transaminase [Acidobacteriota bacterium]REK13181.1 MAG: 3-phosphoserine/phosphohydroxythreonine transaminase [Acidobacteriota bacterium]REK41175.1 MAG: 3-phosphoserine/phosphohydroxythreonine transaminase [Acidobacteriota bacterium]
MDNRIYNFSAGPATLPLPVLERAREELLSFGGIGMSVMEISHRSKHFAPVIEGAVSGIKNALGVPEGYEVLFLQGGATLQFSMIPMNFLGDGPADYIVTGAWGKKALKEAGKTGSANVIYSSEGSGFKTVPSQDELEFTPGTKYVHYTSNETIEGVEFPYDLTADGLPVVCDASSNILSKPIDVSKYSMIYAGAQKNIGPSGVTLVIIGEELLSKVPDNQHSLLDYRAIASKGSMLNTPNTWGIYLIDLVCRWLEEQGGVSAMETRNTAKAGLLYDAIDSSDGFYKGHADPEARSLMNVTFNLPSEELEKRFAEEAADVGLDGLKGHRSVGGIRASIYNAFPEEGVRTLVDFMADFAEKNG